jgi:hypothetical protein
MLHNLYSLVDVYFGYFSNVHEFGARTPITLAFLDHIFGEAKVVYFGCLKALRNLILAVLLLKKGPLLERLRNRSAEETQRGLPHLNNKYSIGYFNRLRPKLKEIKLSSAQLKEGRLGAGPDSYN